MKFLIVGLGNPGPTYFYTRHNIGFLVLDALAKELGVTFEPNRLADVTTARYKGKQLVLAKPSTFMNLSGKAVNYWLQQEKIPLERLMIITDDLALPFGKVRIRPKGSDGGHNGLKNIQETLQTTNYTRLRMGIGDDFSKGKQVDYVLSEWTLEERVGLDSIIDKAALATLSFVTSGLSFTMNQFNN